MSFDSLRKVNISSCKSTHFARNLFLFHKTSIDFSLDFGPQFPSLSRSPNSKQKSTPIFFFSLYFWPKVYLTLSAEALILTESHYTFCKEPSFLVESHFFLGARTSGEQFVVKALPPSSTCSSSPSPRRSLLKTSPSLLQLSKPDLTNISSTFLGYRVLSLTYRVSQKNREKNPNQKWVLWSQIFPWMWLGSAWSCLVLVRNDQITFFPDIGGAGYSWFSLSTIVSAAL